MLKAGNWSPYVKPIHDEHFFFVNARDIFFFAKIFKFFPVKVKLLQYLFLSLIMWEISVKIMCNILYIFLFSLKWNVYTNPIHCTVVTLKEFVVKSILKLTILALMIVIYVCTVLAVGKKTLCLKGFFNKYVHENYKIYLFFFFWVYNIIHVGATHRNSTLAWLSICSGPTLTWLQLLYVIFVVTLD